MSIVPNFCNFLIEGRYVVGAAIGKGSFGIVHEAKDKISEKTVAIKFESRKSAHSQLQNECRVYKVIDGGLGIPRFISYGSIEEYDYLVLEMVGPSLEKLFNYCHRKFSLKTVIMIGEIVLKRIEYVHQMSHIHRDIKPENLAIDFKTARDIYLLDFGLARRYCQITDNIVEHIKLKQSNSFIGTVRYASINAQRVTPSRRDDLESLAYVLLYFIKGKLPWQQIPKPAADATGNASKQRKEKILEMKLSIKMSELCAGLPIEFSLFLKHCRSLGFEEKPNYSYLRRLLSNLFLRSFFVRDLKFDWILEDEKKTDKQIA